MSLQKTSLQKHLAEIRELDVTELDAVSGGDGNELTTTCYTDAGGTKHCVSNRDHI